MDTLAETLPVLGVGASLSFGVAPNPVDLAQAKGGPDFIEYAGAVQQALYRPSIDALHKLGVPVLYHPSCLNLCGPWPNPAQWLEEVNQHVLAVRSPWLAQDVAVCFAGEQPGYSIQLGYFVAPILTERSLDQAVARVTEVRRAVRAPLLLEPPPATFRLGDMPMMRWLGLLAARTGCGLLLDAGHVLSHQLLEDRDVLADLPLDQVFEVHVAGGIIEEAEDRRYYLDAHDLPIQPETWEIFEDLVTRCPNLKAVCLECEGAAASQVLPVLERIRMTATLRSANPDLRAAIRQRAFGKHTPAPIPESCPQPPIPPTPEEVPTAGYPALLRLLFDAELRASLPSQAETVAEELDLDPALVQALDLTGLDLDAQGRRQYLMSALCRGYPLTASALGTLPDGARRLAAFLTSPTLYGALSTRNIAFGDHIQRLLLHSELPPRAIELLGAFVELEQGLITNAARIRAAVNAGSVPPMPQSYNRKQRRKGRLTIPPFTLLLELPMAPEILRAGLDHVTATDAWRRIDSEDLQFSRLAAVLRAQPSPVTMLCRGLAHGVGLERAGAGGASPIIEVAQRTITLRGKQSRKIQAMNGEPLSALAPAGRKLAETLLDAGVMALQ